MEIVEKYETNLDGYVPLRYECDDKVRTSDIYRINIDKLRIITSNNKLMKYTSYHHGYQSVSLYSKSYYVHRVVWVHCNGLIPYGLEVDHIDDNRSNNRITNLQLLTHQQNLLKSVKNRDYSHCKRSRFSKKLVKVTDTVTGVVEVCPSLSCAGILTGINQGIVKMCCDGTNGCKSGVSKLNNHKYLFEYTNEQPTIVNKRGGRLYKADEAEEKNKEHIQKTRQTYYENNVRNTLIVHKMAKLVNKYQKEIDNFSELMKKREKKFNDILHNYHKVVALPL